MNAASLAEAAEKLGFTAEGTDRDPTQPVGETDTNRMPWCAFVGADENGRLPADLEGMLQLLRQCTLAREVKAHIAYGKG